MAMEDTDIWMGVELETSLESSKILKQFVFINQLDNIHKCTHCLYRFLDGQKISDSNLAIQAFEGFIGT